MLFVVSACILRCGDGGDAEFLYLVPVKVAEHSSTYVYLSVCNSIRHSITMTHWYCGSDRTGTNETYRRAYRLVVDTQKSSGRIAKQQHSNKLMDWICFCQYLLFYYN